MKYQKQGIQARVDIRRGERGSRLGPSFFRCSVGPPFRVWHWVFASFCWKAYEPR